MEKDDAAHERHGWDMFEKFSGAGGFIFDCDGTLLDTMGIWREVEAELVEMAGGELAPQDFITLQAVAIDDGARMLHERYGAGTSARALVDYVDGRLLDFYRNVAEPFDGAVEFVLKLREAGVPCCIVSSSPMRFLEAGMRRCGLYSCLAAIVSTETAGCSKQDTRIYRIAAEHMGAQVQACWGADDSLYAIKAMDAAGLKTLAVYGDDKAGTFEELSAHATLAIRSFRELLV